MQTTKTDQDDKKQAYQNLNGFGSDHMSFMDACIPAVLIIDKDNMQFADDFGNFFQFKFFQLQ